VQALSYYKIFGYPTGLGALLVRRDVLPLLRKRFFGGGTVAVSVADADYHRWGLLSVLTLSSCHCCASVLVATADAEHNAWLRTRRLTAPRGVCQRHARTPPQRQPAVQGQQT